MQIEGVALTSRLDTPTPMTSERHGGWKPLGQAGARLAGHGLPHCEKAFFPALGTGAQPSNSPLTSCEGHRPRAWWDLGFLLPEQRRLASLMRAMPAIAGNGDVSSGPPELGYLWDQPQGTGQLVRGRGYHYLINAPVSSLGGRRGLGRGQEKHSPLRHQRCTGL